jgi:hypothetical protein
MNAVPDKFGSKIFQEAPEDNIGNRIETEPMKKRRVVKAG